jgi:hypothetical protein
MADQIFIIHHPDPNFTGHFGIDFYKGKGSTSSLDDAATLLGKGCTIEGDEEIQAKVRGYLNCREAEWKKSLHEDNQHHRPPRESPPVFTLRKPGDPPIKAGDLAAFRAAAKAARAKSKPEKISDLAMHRAAAKAARRKR